MKVELVLDQRQERKDLSDCSSVIGEYFGRFVGSALWRFIMKLLAVKEKFHHNEL